MLRIAPCGVSAVARRSVNRRYTVSSRCKGVSVSGDLNLRRRERELLGSFLEAPREEGLATSVFSSNSLEDPSARTRAF